MSNVSLTESDSGKLVALAQGDELIIELGEPATSGYAWEFDLEPRGRLMPGATQTRSGEEGVGASGKRTFRFKAAAPGTEHLRLKLRRSWEDEQRVERWFAVTVAIR